jgi:glycosyltransferase involved in cell wall biosynthesis
MKKLLGIIGGGMIGRDPFDERAWSGSSRNFFLACQRLNILVDAFGVESPPYKRYVLISLSFSFSKKKWRQKFRLNRLYYQDLTKRIGEKLKEYDRTNISFLQIGGHYNVPSIVPVDMKCYSYHDGNIAQKMASPYFDKSLLPLAKRAFAWEKQVYDKLDKIFTMSDYLRRSFIEDFEQPAEKVINIGVGPNFPLPADVCKNYENKDVVFIGIDFYRKGGDVLVNAVDKIYQKHKDVVLHIIGPYSIPRILREKHRPYVKFYGFLSRKDESQKEVFFSVLKRSTLGILASRYEPFGISLLECMAYGIPCIATNRWAFPEIISDTGALVNVDDINDLVEKIDYFLTYPEIRAQQGQKARERVESKYDWNLVAKRLINALNL